MLRILRLALLAVPGGKRAATGHAAECLGLNLQEIHFEVSGLNAGQCVKHMLILDGLFGLGYVAEDGFTAHRFFVLEVDRGTGPLTTYRYRRKSIERMLAQYDAWIGGKKYKNDLGLTAPKMLLLHLGDQGKPALIIK